MSPCAVNLSCDSSPCPRRRRAKSVEAAQRFNENERALAKLTDQRAEFTQRMNALGDKLSSKQQEVDGAQHSVQKSKDLLQQLKEKVHASTEFDEQMKQYEAKTAQLVAEKEELVCMTALRLVHSVQPFIACRLAPTLI